MAWHRNASTGDIHVIYDQTYATTTARDAATTWNGDSTNIGKIVLVSDTNSLFMLLTVGPTWSPDITGAGSDTLAEILAIGNQTGGTDIVVDTGDKITITDAPALGPSAVNKTYSDANSFYLSDFEGVIGRTVRVNGNGRLTFNVYDLTDADYNFTSEINQNDDAIKISSYTGDGAGGESTDTSINISALGVLGNYIYVKDELGSKGMVYAADYSANFTAQSIIDKAYADAIPNLYNSDITINNLARTMIGTGNSRLTFEMFTPLASNYNTSSKVEQRSEYIFLHAFIGDGAGSTTSEMGIHITPSNGGEKMIFTDQVALKGATYAADYSANFTDRSLIDKAYTDAAVTAALTLYTSDGGFSATARNVVGETGSSINTIMYDLLSSNFTTRTDIAQTSSRFTLSSSNGDGAGASTTTKQIVIDTALTGITVLDSADSIGLLYSADYSANFTARSLVDKAYADAAGAGFWGRVGTTISPAVAGDSISTDSYIWAGANFVAQSNTLSFPDDMTGLIAGYDSGSDRGFFYSGLVVAGSVTTRKPMLFDGSIITLQPTSHLAVTKDALFDQDVTVTLDLAVSGTATRGGYTLGTIGATSHDIHTSAELDALATAGTIAITTALTLNIKASLTNAAVFTLATGSSLTINIDNGVSYTHSSAGTLVTGDGSVTFNGGTIIASGGGTLFSISNTSLFQVVNITRCNLFSWNLGTINFGIVVFRQSAVISHAAPLILNRLNSMKILDFGYIRLGTPLANSIFEVQSAAENTGNVSLVAIDNASGRWESGESVINIKPSVADGVNTTVTATVVGVAGGTLFNQTESTGTFTAVADASLTTVTIDNVTDVAGNARFNYTVPSLYVGQEVIIAGFLTYTLYNQTGIISATNGSTWFEVDGQLYLGSENGTGGFTTNSVTLTDTATALANGDSITLNTDGSTAYDVGTNVYHKLTNSVQVNAPWSATATGAWSTKSLEADSRYVEVSDSGAETSSGNYSFGTVNANATSTTIASSNTYQAMNVAGITQPNFELWKMIDATNGIFEYTGINTFSGALIGTVTATKAGGTQLFRVAVSIDSAVPTYATAAFSPIEVKTTKVQTVLIAHVEITTGQTVQLMIAEEGATDAITITDAQIDVSG